MNITYQKYYLILILSFKELNEFYKKYGFENAAINIVFQIHLQKEVKLDGLN